MSLSFNTISETHKPIFNYLAWGLAEGSFLPTANSLKPLSKIQVEQFTNIVSAYANLKGFKLIRASLAEHYQGKNIEPAKLVWLRFEREDGKNTGLQGEHISATIDINANRLIGLTRMQENLTNAFLVSHQEALDKAITFLKQAAPDLIPNAVASTIKLKAQPAGSKMDFEETPLQIGNVEVHWIGDHKEDITSHGKNVEVHGIKVKMYMPANQLWVWVIVDKAGEIQTFERDVFWNFSLF
jgi:hypothetical protein